MKSHRRWFLRLIINITEFGLLLLVYTWGHNIDGSIWILHIQRKSSILFVSKH